MGAVGGSIIGITMDGRRFPVAADTDANLKLGGTENEVNANGDGSSRMSKTRVPWGVDGLSTENDESRGDHDFLQDLADGNSFFPCTVELASGEVRQGTGQITGELQSSTQSATATFSLMGEGKMTLQ